MAPAGLRLLSKFRPSLSLSRTTFLQPTIMTIVQERNTTSATLAAPTVRPVVSSFLSIGNPRDAATFRVCLLKRSRKAHVYFGQWAACSGSIEAGDKDALTAALREVREEMSVKSRDLELVVAGEPLEIYDKKLATVWKVWTFVWKLRGVKSVEEAIRKVRLDAEHEEMKWVRPEELRRMDTVQGLADTLERVLRLKN